MTNYQELSPQERMVIIAKIYHNIWYDADRYKAIEELLNEWDSNPIKEAKFLNQIHDGTETTTEICRGDFFEQNP